MKRALYFSQDNSHLVGNMSRYLQLVNFLCYCVSISSVNIWSQRISLDGKGETDLKYEESETTFFVHSNWTLKLEPFLRVSVHDSMACALQCCKRVVCLSFNLAVYSRSKNVNCELLQGDKYTSPNNFQASPLYHDHFSRIVSTYWNIVTLFCVCAVFHDILTRKFHSRPQLLLILYFCICCYFIFIYLFFCVIIFLEGEFYALG